MSASESIMQPSSLELNWRKISVTGAMDNSCEDDHGGGVGVDQGLQQIEHLLNQRNISRAYDDDKEEDKIDGDRDSARNDDTDANDNQDVDDEDNATCIALNGTAGLVVDHSVADDHVEVSANLKEDSALLTGSPKASTLRWRKSVLTINASRRFSYLGSSFRPLSEARAGSMSVLLNGSGFEQTEFLTREGASVTPSSTINEQSSILACARSYNGQIEDRQLQDTTALVDDPVVGQGKYCACIRYIEWFWRSAAILSLLCTIFKRLLQLQPSLNVAALIIDSTAMFARGDCAVPLTTLQLIWVNLLMDALNMIRRKSYTNSLQTISSAHDAGVDGTTDDRASTILDWNMKARNVLVQTAYQSAVLITVYFRGIQLLTMAGRQSARPSGDHVLISYYQHDDKVVATIVFNAFVLCQLLDAVNCRVPPQQLNVFQGLHRDWRFLGAVGIITAIQIVWVECLDIYSFASTVKLRWSYWGICTSIGFLTWPIVLLGKFIPVPDKPWLHDFISKLGLLDTSDYLVFGVVLGSSHPPV